MNNPKPKHTVLLIWHLVSEVLLFEHPDLPTSLCRDDCLFAELVEMHRHTKFVVFNTKHWRDDYDYWYRSSFDDDHDAEEEDLSDFIQMQHEKCGSNCLVKMGYAYVCEPFYDRYLNETSIELGLTSEGIRVYKYVSAGFIWNTYGACVSDTDTLTYWRRVLASAANAIWSDAVVLSRTSKQTNAATDCLRLINSGLCSAGLRNQLVADLASAESCFDHYIFWSDGAPDLRRTNRFWRQYLSFEKQDDPVINTMERVSQFPGMRSLWSDVVMRKISLDN